MSSEAWPPPAADNSRIIARNSFWYGLEIAYGVVTAFATSIAMARIIGPQKLGYFNYVMWLTNISGLVASLGIPLTTRKYMAEYLGRGEPGVARAIFFATFRIQLAIASVVTVAGLAVIFTLADPAQRPISAFQVASMLPSMLRAIPSQANMAAENMMANVAGTLVGQSLYILAVSLSLWFHWDLLGIAIGILVYIWVELTVRLVPVLRWMRRLPDGSLPPALRRRMRSFSLQGTLLMLLNIVVWDRSDIVLLKFLSSDIRQITFFSVAFNLAEKALLAPQVFANAIGVTLMAQYGRDKDRLPKMIPTAAKYTFLCAVPLLLGMSALSRPAIRILFGVQYLPAIPVLALAAAFAIPKSVMLPAQHFLQAHEDQKFLVAWSLVCGLVNVLLDWLLIPPFQAVGAAFANGSAQLLAVLGFWARVAQYKTEMRYRGFAKISAAGLAMAVAVGAIGFRLPSWPALAAGLLVGPIVFFCMLRLTSALDQSDRQRLLQFKGSIPAAVRPSFDRLLGFLVPTTQ